MSNVVQGAFVSLKPLQDAKEALSIVKKDVRYFVSWYL